VKVPWHQKTWPRAVGLLVALVCVVAAAWVALRPTSADTLYQRIEKRMRSNDPEEWKRVNSDRGPISEYLKHYGRLDDDHTRQVKTWREQIGVLLADEELTKTVAATKKIDLSKMDDLTEAGKKAV